MKKTNTPTIEDQSRLVAALNESLLCYRRQGNRMKQLRWGTGACWKRTIAELEQASLIDSQSESRASLALLALASAVSETDVAKLRAGLIDAQTLLASWIVDLT